MSDAFSDYINYADQELKDLCRSREIMDEEKRQCVIAFIDSLYKTSFTGKSYPPVKNTIAVASAKCIDSVYSDIDCKRTLSEEDVTLARKLSVRQTNNLNYIKDHGISIPSIRFDQPKVFVDTVVARYDRQLLYERTKSIDDAISSILNNGSDYTTAISSLNNDRINALTLLLDDLDSAVEECKRTHVDTTALKHKDTYGIRRKIEDCRKDRQARDEVISEIRKYDSFIKTQDRGNDFKNNIDELKTACDELNELLKRCEKNNWEIGTLYCDKPIEFRKKYLHYQEMMKIDNELVVLMSGDEPNKETQITNLCNNQLSNKRICRNSRWKVPALLVSDPEKVLAMNNEIIQRRIQKRNRKVILSLTGIMAAFLILLMSIILIRYNLQHTKFPFSPESVVGDDYNEIVRELEDAGYTDVRALSSDEGIQIPGSVVSIDIENVDDVRYGVNYRNDAEITVYYSSADRVDVTKLLGEAETLGYGKTNIEFLQYGFNVRLFELYSNSIENNYQIDSIILNGVRYSGGECFIPSESEVDLYYYGLAISVYENSSHLIGSDYIDVYEQLTEDGFDNISFVRSDDLITGWITDDGSIYDITINGEDFVAGDVYYHGDSVVIYVNTFRNDIYQYIDY